MRLQLFVCVVWTFWCACRKSRDKLTSTGDGKAGKKERKQGQIWGMEKAKWYRSKQRDWGGWWWESWQTKTEKRGWSRGAEGPGQFNGPFVCTVGPPALTGCCRKNTHTHTQTFRHTSYLSVSFFPYLSLPLPFPLLRPVWTALEPSSSCSTTEIELLSFCQLKHTQLLCNSFIMCSP